MKIHDKDIKWMLQQGENSQREFKQVQFAGNKPESSQQTDWINEIVALANTRGGMILFGVTDGGNIQDMSQLKLKNLNQILENISSDVIYPTIKIDASSHVFSNGKCLLLVQVDEGVAVHHGPNGAYTRSGSSTRKMTNNEMLRLAQKRAQARFHWFDEHPVPYTGFHTLDKNLWKPLLSSEGAGNPELSLEKMRLLAKDEHGQMRATVTGILVGCTAPEQWLPNACIRAAYYRGNDQAAAQVDAKIFGGPVNSQILEALSFVHRNMRVAARKEPGRVDMPQYSLRAIFEAIVNAVVHRDYAIRGSSIRLLMFENRLEIYSPGGLPNNLTLESMPQRQATRNEALTSALSRMRTGHISDVESREFFIERRGDGIPIILHETKELSGKSPEYKLIDDSEISLVIPAASVEVSPESVVISAYHNGHPLPGINILGLFPNHTGKQATTDKWGNATLDLHSIHLPMTVFAAADGFAAHLEQDWVPANRALAIEMNPLPFGSGSVIFLAGIGEIPELEGRLNPVLDPYDRTYLYASNIAINQGQKQPVHFVLSEELRLTDSNGTEKLIRITAIQGRAALVEYSPVEPNAPLADPKRYKIKKGAHLFKETQSAHQPPHEVFCAWTFSNADKDGPWAISEGDLKDVTEKLTQFETMTRSDLVKRASHLVPIQSLSKKAQARLKKIKGRDWLEDSDGIFSFCISGKKRLWCIKDITPENNQIIYQILWWDPEHQVCPSEKKHT